MEFIRKPKVRNLRKRIEDEGATAEEYPNVSVDLIKPEATETASGTYSYGK